MNIARCRCGMIALILWTAVFIGCATQLAPLYDKAIVDGITTTNKDAMTFFALMSNGTTSHGYQDRADAYNKLIGNLDALEIQAQARPVPKTKTVDAVNKWLEKRGLPAVTDDGIPSATALKEMAKTLKKMRDTDRKQGVTATEVQAFKNQTSIYMDQAMTYESFLKR